MTRQEFIDELRIALQGQVDQATINDSVSYYETYIIQESRKGRSEDEVIEGLGSPRLIAKTIIDDYQAGGAKRRHSNQGSYNSNYNRDYSSENYTSREDEGYGRTIHLESKSKLLAITAIIAILVIVVGIIALVAGVISLLAPVLIPLLLILLAIRLFSRR